MTTISDERAERAALAHRTELARCYGREPMPLEWWRKQGFWKHEISAARAALIADAPAILAAKIEGLKEAQSQIATLQAALENIAAYDEDYAIRVPVHVCRIARDALAVIKQTQATTP